MRHIVAIARNEYRMVVRDPSFLVLTVLMPIPVIAFIKPALRPALVDAGYATANGSEIAVPGMAMLFAFFLVSNTTTTFFREHSWLTWGRLRASSASPLAIIVGKTLPALITNALQIGVLFAVGIFVFDLHVSGSVTGAVLVAASLSLFLVAFALALVTLMRTIQQVNTVSNLGAMVFAGLGGALTPSFLLPGWAKTIAPATPTYWAMRGFRAVILDGQGVGSVALPVAILVVAAALLTSLATWRLGTKNATLTFA